MKILQVSFRVCHENYRRYPLYHPYIERPHQAKMITRNLESLIFYGIAKILIDPKSLEETRQTWTMLYLVKSFD